MSMSEMAIFRQLRQQLMIRVSGSWNGRMIFGVDEAIRSQLDFRCAPDCRCSDVHAPRRELDGRSVLRDCRVCHIGEDFDCEMV
jgi:hypothetical protein